MSGRRRGGDGGKERSTLKNEGSGGIGDGGGSETTEGVGSLGCRKVLDESEGLGDWWLRLGWVGGGRRRGREWGGLRRDGEKIRGGRRSDVVLLEYESLQRKEPRRREVS